MAQPAVQYSPSNPLERDMRQRWDARWRSGSAPTKHLDPVLVVAVLLLVGFGMLAIWSAKHAQLQLQGLPTDYYVARQAVALGVGLVGMVVAAAVPYRLIRTWTPVLYLGVVGLLVLVLVIGSEQNGATSWIPIGAFQFQPSEFAKIAVVLGSATLLASSNEQSPGILRLLGALALTAVPLGLIVLQPDPGTGLMLLFGLFSVLLVAGVAARYLFALVAAGIGALWGILQLGLLEQHQSDRLTSFFSPGDSELARSLNYNTDQSLIAVGSGRVTGKGLLEGTQTNLSYVPENHTDFIFTVIGEEFGFVGGALLLGLFAVVLYRCLRTAGAARDRFGMLLAAGMGGLLAFQLFVNVGMAIGIVPVIGVPLPLVSYGGTSLIATLTMIGLVLNVHMRRFRAA